VSLQKREAVRALEQDLKAEISLVKRHEYERLYEHSLGVVGLGAIDRQVRMDSRLTLADRILLLNAVGKRFTFSVGASRLRRARRVDD